MRFGFVVAALAILVAGSHSQAVSQQPEAWIVGRAGDALAISQRAGPFAALLDRAAELALTSNQVGRIRDIQRRLVRTNEPLQAQIRDAELWGVASEEEEQALESVRETFQANAAAAELEVEEVLSAEQLQQARTLIEGDALAYSGPTEPEVPVEEKRTVSTMVRVENLNYLDATVYIHSGSRNQRLGFVTGLTSQTFTVPAQLLAGGTSLRFQVRYVGRSGSRSSDSVIVNPGDEVLLRIPTF